MSENRIQHIDTYIRITKEFTFEMAHALWNYNGKCRNIHGHTYVLSVCLRGKLKQKFGDPDDGLLMDFGQLKNIIQDQIISTHDHALVLNKSDALAEIGQLKTHDRLVLKPYQPTVENLLIDFVDEIKLCLPAHLELFSLKLRETQTAFAEWFHTDNLNHE